MRENEQRDELARVIHSSRKPWVTNTEHRRMEAEQADAIIAAGYSKPTILGYLVMGRDGWTVGGHYPTREEAQTQADEWNKDVQSAGVDWDYRVAEIVEATR